jgi:hypothetical protein
VVALPPATPFTCHVTAVLEEFVTVAVNWEVCPCFNVAEVGEMVTETALESPLFLLPPPQLVMISKLAARSTNKDFIAKVSAKFGMRTEAPISWVEISAGAASETETNPATYR